MRISAKVIEDSVNEFNNKRLTTFQLEYPRMQHAEFMTHRVFSRNASSSRAIPVERLVGMALEDPAFFVKIGTNKPGMQAGEEVSDEIKAKFKAEWEELAHIVAEYSLRWAREYKIHKQIANRPMEPWHHIAVVMTTTEIDNFFELRDHEAADPNIEALAKAIRAARDASTPKLLKEGEWHLPYVTEEERKVLTVGQACKASAARCARVSYYNHDGSNPDLMKDFALFETLAESRPLHLSPTEHQAKPYTDILSSVPPSWVSNLQGWVQLRKFIENAVIPR